MRSRSLRAALPALLAAALCTSACARRAPAAGPRGAGEAAALWSATEEDRAALPAHWTRPLFWRVDGGAGSALHLLGSVHVGPAEGWSHPPLVEAAFAASNTLVVELDTRSLDPAAQQALLFEYAMLPPGESLRERLSPQTWDLLARQVERSGLELASLERLQPWMVANLLVIDAAGRRGLSPQMGVDHDFLGRAGARRVLALETSQEQMSLMAGLGDELQEFSLRDTLGHADDIGDYLEAMVEAWRLGDEPALSLLLFEGMDEHAESAAFFDRLIFERNRSMAARLAQLLDDERGAGEAAFAVLGAGHLIGDRSVCALLAERGYRVQSLAGGPRTGARDGGD